MDATEKKEMQEAIGNGTWRGRYTETEILDYCEKRRFALGQLLPAMLPRIDLPRALLRGRYMAAAAPWNTTACRLTSRRSSCCESTGTISRTI